MRKKIFPLLILGFCCTTVFAQPKKVTVPEQPLDSLNDEFSTSASINNWQQFHATGDYPNKWKTLGVTNGVLNLQPYASGWYGDYQAPFMYKTITGNFDVRTRIKVSGEKDALPQTEWSLAGLMVRQPSKPGVAWEPRNENWLFLTTGIAEPKGTAMLEAKSTNNSVSNLKLRPAKEGWVELRIVRLHASFILLYRYEGEEWIIADRFYRPQMPQQLQVGINAYTGWNQLPANVKADPALHNKSILKDVPGDILVQVDHVRFARPAINREKLNAFVKQGFNAPYYHPGNLLTDYSISNSELLEILNDNKTN